MRAAGRLGRVVVLRLRFDDFARASRSHTLAEPTAHTSTVLAAVRGLLRGVMPAVSTRGLTLLGISVGDLDDDGAVQLALPFDRASGAGVDPGVGPALDVALDGVRTKFGSAAVTRAVLLGQDPGLSVPLLPD